MANVVTGVADVAISPIDHLPFSEMVAKVRPDAKEVDIFLATPGGSAEQVNQFVAALRPRFDRVEFLIPYMAMSAGTLWALSGDAIWMDERAFLGPIDPQVPAKDGRLVPIQSLLTVLSTIQREGQEAIDNGKQPPWSHVQLLKELDLRQLGAAMSASQYVISLAAEFLERYKFKDWVTHSSTGEAVDAADRAQRAKVAATQLCSHDRWKAHGHAINRDIAVSELRIRIEKPETTDGLLRAMRRLWALFVYILDKVPIMKMIISADYTFIRQVVLR